MFKQKVFRSGIYSAILSQFEPRRWRVSFQVCDIQRDRDLYRRKKKAMEDIEEWLAKSGEFKPGDQLPL